jgi:predicted metal-dependent peptidase
VVKNVLFMIDTSGSISDTRVSAAYSEIKGAIDQYDGRLCGWLGFFDAAIYEPTPFEDVSELLKIKPVGGGGTDFSIVFKYVREHMKADPPVSIVLLTDGIAPFPNEKETMGIPVLWLLTNEEITPPWGKIARIKVG